MTKRAAKPANKRSGSPAKPVPAAPQMPEQATLLYTIGFSLAVVAFVIGIYQTMVEKDLASNYWLFMIAAGFLLLVRWDRLRRDKKQLPK